MTLWITAISSAFAGILFGSFLSACIWEEECTAWMQYAAYLHECTRKGERHPWDFKLFCKRRRDKTPPEVTL